MHSVVGEEKMRETGAEYVSFFLVRCVCVFFFYLCSGTICLAFATVWS